jgi:DNA-binding GntR family transcriptional regulator
MDSDEAVLEGRHGQAVDYTVQRLRNAIFAGQLVPGQRLVAADLTTEVGVSRGTILQAFQRLSADGLLEIIPNRGAIIRRLSRDQVRNLFQIRENLEGLAAKLAAENIAQGNNRAFFTKTWKSVRPTAAPLESQIFMQHNRVFHRSIVRISGNDKLSDLIDTLHLPVMMFQVGQVMQPENLKSSQEDHVRVAEAILEGNSRKAEREMRAHLRRSAEWVLQLPSIAFKSSTN